MIALARAVPEKLLRPTGRAAAWARALGLGALAIGDATLAFLKFLGEAALAVVRFARGRANFRWIDLAGSSRRAGRVPSRSCH